MSLNKPQLNQLQEGLCYILRRDILTKLALTLTFINQKNLNLFLLSCFTQEVIWLLDVYINIHVWIYTFNDHYFNPLLDNLSKKANKTTVLIGDFNNDLLNLDTSEYISTFLDDTPGICYNPEFFYQPEYLRTVKL